MLIDTHAHLADAAFDGDRREVIERALAAGVGHMVAVSFDLESAKKTVEIARQYPCLHPALGVHPNEASKFAGDYEKEFWRLFDGAEKIAVGEIGLDYYRDTVPRNTQVDVLAKFLKKAAGTGLPLIIHNRNADEDILKLLGGFPRGTFTGVFHCFSGSAGFARKVIDLGFYVSFAGQITFPNAKELRESVRAIPIEKTVIETDCPYLAPQTYRGKRNEPAWLRCVAEELAALKGLSPEDVSRITSFNVRNLFGIGSRDEKGKIAYEIRDSLYLNITNSCTSACTFCVRYYSDYVKGHNLRLKADPGYEEIVAAIGDPQRYREIVFCGYGEPLLRLDVVKKIAAYVKSKGVAVRIDTNGHGNLINGRPVAAELKGLVDAISVSLNADTKEKYDKICQPEYGPATYDEVKRFVLECKAAVPKVSVTVVAVPEVDIEKCRKIAAEELGVELRVRQYDDVG
jgi:TatD DNase family protein